MVKLLRRLFSLRLSLLLAILLTANAALLVSCAPTVGPTSEFTSLRNRGLLGVSSSSPSVGANLFLGRELESSQNLRRFFDDAGAPIAIELKDGAFRSGELRLFYLPNRVFTATRAPTPHENEWIIRGPRSVSRTEFNEIRELQASEGSTAVFTVFARERRYELGGRDTQLVRRPDGIRGSSTVEPEIPHIPRPTPTPRPRPTPEPTEKESAPKPKVTLPSSQAKLNARDWLNLNLNQRAILISQGYAPRTEAGDIIHRVQTSSETVAQIAGWYTGNADNVTQVAVANNLRVDEKLEPGQSLVIPLGLVTEYRQMK